MTPAQGYYCRGRPISPGNAPDLGLLPDGENSILRDDVIYIDAAGDMHVAIHGLTTDGGSIPRVFWRLVGHPWSGRHRYAFLIHDQECRDVYMLPRQLRDGARKQADKTLREGVRFLSGSACRAAAIYAGVRIGWTCWIRYQRPSKK